MNASCYVVFMIGQEPCFNILLCYNEQGQGQRESLIYSYTMPIDEFSPGTLEMGSMLTCFVLPYIPHGISYVLHRAYIIFYFFRNVVKILLCRF